MKKLLQGIVITCAAVTTPAIGQTGVYACQYVMNAGLNWENGSWVVSRFTKNKPFILITENGSLKPASVAAYFGGERGLTDPPSFLLPICTEPWIGNPNVQTCTTPVGETMSFSTTTLAGTVAQLYGGMQHQSNVRTATVTVAPFVCSKS